MGEPRDLEIGEITRLSSGTECCCCQCWSQCNIGLATLSFLAIHQCKRCLQCASIQTVVWERESLRSVCSTVTAHTCTPAFHSHCHCPHLHTCLPFPLSLPTPAHLPYIPTVTAHTCTPAFHSHCHCPHLHTCLPFPLSLPTPAFHSRCRCIFVPRSSQTTDLRIGIPVATLPDAWHYRVSAGTGWLGVSIR